MLLREENQGEHTVNALKVSEPGADFQVKVYNDRKYLVRKKRKRIVTKIKKAE